MKEDGQEKAAFAAWVNQELRIVTFRVAEGYEKITFQSQNEKFAYVLHLCELGYRIL